MVKVIKVMKVNMCGSTLILSEEQKDSLWDYVGDWGDQECEMEITFTTMKNVEFLALPEFEGF